MKKKILVLCGGISKERLISLDTGKQVSSELKKNGYRIKTSEPDKSLLKNIKIFKPNIIFNALHGQYGEDGYIQAILETQKIPYTHSGVIASSIAMDKEISKKIFIKNNILTPKYIKFSYKENEVNIIKIIEKKLGSKNTNFSVEILSKALELTSEGSTTKDEQKILEGIVSFGNTETVQIMKPRIDIFALSETESFEEVLTKILKYGYSRNPIYKDSIDNIIGVLYSKDLLGHLNNKEFEWQKILREPFFVPENKKLDDLLGEFRERKNHLAIVVDEYGGTSGLVTLEDVIEEIVGDINDEFDDDDLSYSKIDANNYIFDGKITIKDFCKVLEDLDEEKFEKLKGESETIAGFILELYGKFPKIGEKIKFDIYTFTIEALDRKRIKQLKVTKHIHA